MEKLKVLDLFSGIGGFSLGLERTGGFETVAFCDIEEFPRRVLAKHWPEVPCYNDVRTLTADALERDGVCPNVITGGFPCQDISLAGKRAGINGETRSGLWSEISRLASEIRPDFLIVENVSNLLAGPSERNGGWFGRVLGDLAEIGYDAEWHCIPSSFIGGWSERDRVWILAYPAEKLGQRLSTQPVLWQRSLQIELRGGFEEWPGRSNLPDTRFCRTSNGVPHRLDRIAALGNAVVPQIPELIGRAILEAVA